MIHEIMSSDSEDDCYGNIAQKLQSIKNKYEEDKIKTTILLNSPQLETAKPVDKVIKIAENSPHNACNVLKDDSDCEELSLDAIIAQNSKKKPTRKSKRSADISTDNILTQGRKRTRASRAKFDHSVDLDSSFNVSDLSVVEPPSESAHSSVNTTKRKGRARQRGRKGKNASITTSITNITTSNPSNSTVNTACTINTTSSALVNAGSSISAINSSVSIPRGRNRRERRPNSRRSGQVSLPEFLTAMFGLGNSAYPTYSVGNTDDYPDDSYNQPLFNEPKKDEVVTVDENNLELNDSVDENEELSVKVYWQNSECIKFTIRRFQKLQPIFDFFANRENVSHDKLFFTYNDKILKIYDTPDSITYSIVKFIDGGIIKQSVSKIVQNDNTAKEGIKLKFQCQHLKKPYETYVRSEDKLAVAMTMCAEHLEKPLEKLKFLFDGDVISGKNTPRELDLEGGECIDVKIIS